jgi:hypothetical protein
LFIGCRPLQEEPAIVLDKMRVEVKEEYKLYKASATYTATI